MCIFEGLNTLLVRAEQNGKGGSPKTMGDLQTGIFYLFRGLKF